MTAGHAGCELLIRILLEVVTKCSSTCGTWFRKALGDWLNLLINIFAICRYWKHFEVWWKFESAIYSQWRRVTWFASGGSSEGTKFCHKVFISYELLFCKIFKIDMRKFSRSCILVGPVATWITSGCLFANKKDCGFWPQSLLILWVNTGDRNRTCFLLRPSSMSGIEPLHR